MLGYENLREYQHLAIDFLESHRRCNLFAQMGLGKTVSTLTALDTMFMFGVETRPVLIPAPKRVAASTWPDEAKNWSHLRHIDVSPIVGSVEQRRAALKRDVSVYTINYENLPWLRKELGKRWPFGTVAPDESTKLKSYRGSWQKHHISGKLFIRKGGSVRASALADVAHLTPRWINLTGTPASNGVVDLWGQQWFIDGGKRLGRTFEGFSERWFRSVPGSTIQQSRVEPLAHAQAEIEAAIADCTLSINAADWFDLKAPVESKVYVDMPAAAVDVYRSMEREMFANINERTIEAFNAAGKSQKLKQIAAGAVYLDPDADSDEHPKSKEWRELHDAKLQALESIVTECCGAPVLVAFHFRSDLARLLKAFPTAQLLDDKPQTIRDWNAGKIPMLLAHPASAGHGLNLQHGGNVLVYFSLDWNAEFHNQIFERLGPVRQLQAGYTRNVFVYYILARRTVDDDVFDRLKLKISVEEALMRGLSRRNA